MLPANPAQAYGYLKAPAPSKLYGQAAIMHSSDNCGGFPCHRGQDGGRAYGHDRNTLWLHPGPKPASCATARRHRSPVARSGMARRITVVRGCPPLTSGLGCALSSEDARSWPTTWI